MSTEQLTPKQQRAITLLASGKSARATAAVLKCGERTVRNWLSLPSFKAALAEAEAGVLADLSRQVLTLPEKAIEVVRAVLEDDTASASTRLRAAALAIDSLLKVRELGIEQRLTALEQALAERDRNGKGYAT